MLPILDEEVGNVYNPSMVSSKRFPSAGESTQKNGETQYEASRKTFKKLRKQHKQLKKPYAHRENQKNI